MKSRATLNKTEVDINGPNICSCEQSLIEANHGIDLPYQASMIRAIKLDAIPLLKWATDSALSGFKKIITGINTNGRKQWTTVKNQCRCDGVTLKKLTHLEHCYMFQGLRDDIYQQTGFTLEGTLDRSRMYR
jgi:hypothetical protein